MSDAGSSSLRAEQSCPVRVNVVKVSQWQWIATEISENRYNTVISFGTRYFRLHTLGDKSLNISHFSQFH